MVWNLENWEKKLMKVLLIAHGIRFVASTTETETHWILEELFRIF